MRIPRTLIIVIAALAVNKNVSAEILSDSFLNYLTFVHKHEYDMELRSDYQHASNDSGSSSGFTLMQETFDAAAPVPLSVNTLVSLGIDIEHTEIKAQQQQGISWNDINLTKVAAEIGFSHSISDTLLLEAGINPGLYSDFSDSIHQRDLLGDAGMAIYYRINNTMAVLGGFYGQQADDLDSYLPIAGIRYEPCDRCYLSVTAPLEAHFNYRLPCKVELFANYQGVGDRYSIRTAHSDHVTIEESFKIIGAGLKIPLINGFSLVPAIGYSISPSIDRIHSRSSLKLEDALVGSISVEDSFHQ